VVHERPTGAVTSRCPRAWPHRQVAAGEPRDRGRPGPGRVHDRAGAERARRRAHGGDAAVRVVLEAEDLAAAAHLRTEPARVGEQRGGREHRLDLRIVGVVRAEVEVVGEVRLELAQPARRAAAR
jgi:hypothetical protein